MGSKWVVLAGALAAALLCTALSFAQEAPKPPAAQPAAQASGAKTATPAAKAPAPAARFATPPAQVDLPPPKRTWPASSVAGAHTNVKTTEGLEKRASQTGKPAAMASPAAAPQ
jgi:hypothetical protein